MSPGRLRDKVALIVGGGADGPAAKGEALAIGNGRATAIVCAREGARVMVADRDLASAEATADAIRAEGGDARAVACDVLVASACRDAVAATVAAFGALHLLVNNVGVADLGTAVDTNVGDFDRILAVNVRGHFLAIQGALPEIARAGGGAIVNVSSLNAHRSGAGVAYETSKAALFGLTRNVSVTAAPLGIRVNTITPGVIDSTMLRRFVGDSGLDFSSRIPLGRHGSPWDVAKAIAFLLSDDAAFITGTELVVDGGMSVPM